MEEQELTPVALSDKMFKEAQKLELSDQALFVATKAALIAEKAYKDAKGISRYKLEAGWIPDIEGSPKPAKLHVSGHDNIIDMLCSTVWHEWQIKVADVQRIKAKTERLRTIISVAQSVNKNLSHIIE